MSLYHKIRICQYKIQKIIFDVDKKEKTALTHLDNVVIEGQEEALSAKDIARYIKNREMPASREVFSNAVVKEILEPNEATRIVFEKDASGKTYQTRIFREDKGTITKYKPDLVCNSNVYYRTYEG